jgi:hypothetical protein
MYFVREIGLDDMDRIYKAQDRDKCLYVVKTVKKVWVLLNA